MKRIALAGCLCLLLAAPLCAQNAGQVGQKSPDVTAQEWVNSQPTSLNALNQAGKAVVIEFWATW